MLWLTTDLENILGTGEGVTFPGNGEFDRWKGVYGGAVYSILQRRKRETNQQITSAIYNTSFIYHSRKYSQKGVDVICRPIVAGDNKTCHTSPLITALAPIFWLSASTSWDGPTIRDVPVSTMKLHPPLQ